MLRCPRWGMTMKMRRGQEEVERGWPLTMSALRVEAMVILQATVVIAATAATATTSATTTSSSEINSEGRPVGWDDASHGNDVDPNYAVVFPQDRVNQITITMIKKKRTMNQHTTRKVR